MKLKDTYRFDIKERCGLSNVANTTSSTDSMDIIVDAFWNVIVNDMTHVGDIWNEET